MYLIINAVVSKLKTGAWFSLRPQYWAFASDLLFRLFRPNLDSIYYRALARKWAARRQTTLTSALAKLGLEHQENNAFPASLLSSAQARVERAGAVLGGPAALDLLFKIASNLKHGRVIETGVAFGWSSLSILEGLRQSKTNGLLVSVDMPYLKMNTEDLVGLAVPAGVYQNWILVRRPDKPGIRNAIALCGGSIDLCHFDSDKSWWGRAYAYPKLWSALITGGIFVSDDIQDNLYFAVFMRRVRATFSVIKEGDKYVGIAVKN